uniref:Uncharacterized protein n=1 Tax=Psilocybe cubensis TaxID=181762 RepID=A0A8H7XUI2_PSICU
MPDPQLADTEVPDAFGAPLSRSISCDSSVLTLTDLNTNFEEDDVDEQCEAEITRTARPTNNEVVAAALAATTALT